jgi:formate C-acetyltransferase
VINRFAFYVRQIEALQELKEMAHTYGIDISEPATNSREAVQWVYLGFLGAVKQQDGVATSLGRIDAFLDIYFERDLQAGTITEADAQELIDHLMIKLQMIRHSRPGIEKFYTGNPNMVTLTLGGSRYV